MDGGYRIAYNTCRQPLQGTTSPGEIEPDRFDDDGNWINEERPDRYIEEILRFLDEGAE